VRKRLIKRKSQSSPPLTCKPTPREAVKRKQWTDQQMRAAIKAVEESTGINKAAGDHGVPPSSLKDRVSGRVKHGDKPGPKPEKKKQEQAKRKREATGARKCSNEVKRKRKCCKDCPKGSKAGKAREINLNICCRCDGLYDQDVVEGTGANWLVCACGRWLHEECVDACIRNESKDHICLDNFATIFA